MELDLATVISEFKTVFDDLQPAIRVQPGWMGDGNGTVHGFDDGSQGFGSYSLVRVGRPDVPAVAIFNDAMPEVDGLEVWVGMTPDRPGLFRVIGAKTSGYVQQGIPPGIGPLVKHADQHYYLNSDPVYAHIRQWTPLRIYLAGGMLVTLQGDVFRTDAGFVTIPTTTYDLTSYRPGSGGNWVVISLDRADGSVEFTQGSVIYELDVTQIPVTPDGLFDLAAVYVYAGQSAIREDRGEIDIYDLRWPQSGSGSDVIGSGASPRLALWSASKTLGSDAEMLWDATNAALVVGGDDDVTQVAAGAGFVNIRDGTSGGYAVEIYGTNHPTFAAFRARGTRASPSAVQTDDVLARWSARGYGASSWASASRARLDFVAAEDWTNSAQGTHLDFFTTQATTTTTSQVARLTDAGQFQLMVAGSAGGLLIASGQIYWDDTLGYLASSDGLIVSEIYARGDSEWGLSERLAFAGFAGLTPTTDFLTDKSPLSSWAGSPFATPSSESYAVPSNLQVFNASANTRSFAYKTVSVGTGASVSQRLRLNVGLNVERGGLRIDDGSDSNYVELAFRSQGLTGLVELIKVVNGVTTVLIGNLVPGYYTIMLTVTTTNTFGYYTRDGRDVLFVTTLASGRGYTITRIGIIHTQGGTGGNPRYTEFDKYYTSA